MVYVGVNSPHKSGPLFVVWPLPAPSHLKIMTLKSPPQLFIPPNPNDITAMTRHLT